MIRALYLIILDCLNNFVQIKFDQSTSTALTITCIFPNEPATIEKKCDVSYSMCQQGPDQINITRSNPTHDTTVSVTLELDSIQTFCYTITATSGNSTIEVEGKYGRCSFLAWMDKLRVFLAI